MPTLMHKPKPARQYQKNAIKAKNNDRKKYFERKQKEQLAKLATMLGKKFKTVKESIYAGLDKIIQSSAIVENKIIHLTL